MILYIAKVVNASLLRLNNVSCLSLSFLLITNGDDCVLIKVDWLAPCIALRVVGSVLVVFLLRWRKFSTTPANGKQGPIPEEMSQTMLTNNKQGNLD
jgi:hypothetical protein